MFEFRLRLALAALFFFNDPSFALEKIAVRTDDDWETDWRSGSSCLINYFNICNGWSWCWSGFSTDERIGLIVDSCCENSTLLETALYVCSTAGPIYSTSGTISAHQVDAADCLVEPPFASQPFFPVIPGYLVNAWQGVPIPGRFAIVVKAPATWTSTPSFGTDRPASPGMPCGTCYPVDRPIRSFFFGTPSVPQCPGEPFGTGPCYAELMCHVLVSCPTAVSSPGDIEHSTWGAIKSLYH